MALGSGLFSAGVASAGGAGTRIGAAFVEIFADTSGLRKGFAETETLMTSLGARLQTTGAIIGRTGSFITRNLSLPLAALGGVSVKMAADFDQAMTRTVALAGARAVGTMDELRASVLQLSAETAQAPKDIADSLFFVASAGLKTAEVMPVLEATAQGAAAQLGDAATLGQLLTSVLVAYGKDAPTAASAMDTLTEAIKKGKAEPLDLSKSLGTVIPVAAEMGVSFDEIAAAIAASTNQGIEATRAATGLRYMLIQLANPSEQAKNILNEFGTSIQEVQTNVSEHGLVDALSELKDQFDLSTAAGKEAFFTAVGGVRAGQVALALVGKNMQAAQEITRATARAAGDAGDEFQTAFKKMTDTPAFRFQKAWNDLKIAAIDAGTALMPIAEDIVDAVGDLANWFTNLDDASQGALLEIGKWVVIGGPVLKMFGWLAGSIGKVVSAFEAMKVASAASGIAKLGTTGATAAIPGQMVLPGMEAAGATAVGPLARVGAIAQGFGEVGLAVAGVVAVGTLFSRLMEDVGMNTQEAADAAGLTTEQIHALDNQLGETGTAFNLFTSKLDKEVEIGGIVNEVIKDLTDNGLSLSSAMTQVNDNFDQSIHDLGGLTGSVDTFEQNLRGRLGILEVDDAVTMLRRHFDELQDSVTEVRGLGGQVLSKSDFDPEMAKQLATTMDQITASGIDMNRVMNQVFGGPQGLAAMIEKGTFSWRDFQETFGKDVPFMGKGIDEWTSQFLLFADVPFKMKKGFSDLFETISGAGLDPGTMENFLAARDQALDTSGFAGLAVAPLEYKAVMEALATDIMPQVARRATEVAGSLSAQKAQLLADAIAAGHYGDALRILDNIERRRERRQQRRRGAPTTEMQQARAELAELQTLQTEFGKPLGAFLAVPKGAIDPSIVDTMRGFVDQGFRLADLTKGEKLDLKVALDKGDVAGAINTVLRALNRLDKKKAKPKVDPDTEDAERDIKGVQDDMDDLDNTRANPKVTASIIGLDGVRNLWALINQLPSQKTITINTVAGGVNIPSWKTEQYGGWIGGSGRGDIIPAMLEPGEFVVRREVAQRNKAFLDSFNGGGGNLAFHRPSRGGRPSSPVMSMSRSGAGVGGGGGNKNLTVNVQGRMEYTPRDLRRNLEGWWRRRDW